VPTTRETPLPGGRKLAWEEYGDPEGIPVLWFHGSPSCRLEPTLVGDGRLRSLEHFAVLGNSGGAPYVAACAIAMPQRLSRAVIVSGGWDMTSAEVRGAVPFMNRMVFVMARGAPWLLGLLFRAMASSMQGDPAKELQQLKSRVPPADFASFSKPGRVEALGRLVRVAMRHGPRGAVHDMGLYVRGFDIDPRQVRAPITWFHGGQDANSPIALARRVCTEMPGATLVELAADAHLSTLCEHMDEIARELRASPSTENP
jgi:pimeloyl-ACP methyl ester carboxylesterase